MKGSLKVMEVYSEILEMSSIVQINKIIFNYQLLVFLSDKSLHELQKVYLTMHIYWNVVVLKSLISFKLFSKNSINIGYCI